MQFRKSKIIINKHFHCHYYIEVVVVGKFVQGEGEKKLYQLTHRQHINSDKLHHSLCYV